MVARLLLVATLALITTIALAQPPPLNGEKPNPARATDESAARLFGKMLGTWEGTCRTWFEPGKLADESTVTGEITEVLNGSFIRHVYQSSIQQKPRHGEEIVGFNSITKRFQTAWVDDFHMNYAIMFSEGEGSDQGFRVRGNYDVGDNQPQWGWRTEFRLLDDDHLTITAYNILPEGTDAKAVETIYHRVKSSADR